MTSKNHTNIFYAVFGLLVSPFCPAGPGIPSKPWLPFGPGSPLFPVGPTLPEANTF